jgi:hypothetical protein
MSQPAFRSLVFRCFAVILLLSLFSLSANSWSAVLLGPARQKEIARKVNVLGNLGFGVRTHKSQGATADELVRALAIAQGALNSAMNSNSDFLSGATAKDFNFGDMTKWGTTNLASAQELFASGDGSDEDAIKQRRRATLGKTILGELERIPQVSFGFTSGSSSYCGVSFMGLLIVDEENGVIYELSLTSSGPC